MLLYPIVWLDPVSKWNRPTDLKRDDFFRLLGYYEVQVGLKPTFRDTYQSPPQG
jgi:hypothetical protein